MAKWEGSGIKTRRLGRGRGRSCTNWNHVGYIVYNDPPRNHVTSTVVQGNNYLCIKISTWKLYKLCITLYNAVYLDKLHFITDYGNVMLHWLLAKNRDLDLWLSANLHPCPLTFTLTAVTGNPTVSMSVTPLVDWTNHLLGDMAITTM